jgi:hypothetical protein
MAQLVRAKSEALVDIETKIGSTGRSIAPASDIIRGEAILLFGGVVSPTATRESIQIGLTEHLVSVDGFDDLIDHSCDANAELRLADLALIASRDIARGEPFTLNYLLTEAQLATPFWCQCGAHACFGRISGYDALTPSQKWVLGATAMPWLRNPRFQTTCLG